MKDCNKQARHEKGMKTKWTWKGSNHNTIRGRGTGWKMKGTQQKYSQQDSKKADLDRHRQCRKRTFRSLLVDTSNLMLWAIPKHFNKLLEILATHKKTQNLQEISQLL